MGASDQRKSEFHQIIQGKTLSQTTSNRNNNQKVMGSSCQNFNKNNGKSSNIYFSKLFAPWLETFADAGDGDEGGPFGTISGNCTKMIIPF